MVFLNMPDFTSSTELEYITWKVNATYIVNEMLWVVALSWGMERGRLKSGDSDGWQGFRRPHRLVPLEAHPAGPGHFACNSLSVSFVSSSHVDVQVFAPSRALVISWTRDCRSSDLITGEMLLSACNDAISLLQTSFGCFKQWMECFAFVGLGEDDLCEEQQQKKSRILNFGPWVVGKTYSPMLSW